MDEYIETMPGETDISSPVDAETSKWEMDLAQDLEELHHYLRGETWNMKAQEWQQTLEPMVNEQGANEIIGFIKASTGKNASLTDMTPEEVSNHMKLIHRTFARIMTENGAKKRWGLPSVSTGYSITAMVLEFIFPNKTRARDKTILNYRRAHEKSSTVYTNTPKRGVIGKMLG
jgi:hypothetical protein